MGLSRHSSPLSVRGWAERSGSDRFICSVLQTPHMYPMSDRGGLWVHFCSVCVHKLAYLTIVGSDRFIGEMSGIVMDLM